MVKIPETHTPSSISLGRNTPDSLNAVGSNMRNPYADAMDTLGTGLNMFGKTLEKEQAEKLRIAGEAQKEVLSSQLKEYQARLSMLMSDLRAKNDGREIDPNEVVLLGSRGLEQAFDAKQYKAFGISAPLPQELREKAKGITFDTVRSNYETVQRSNVALVAKQTAERNKLASEAYVSDISTGNIPLYGIGAAQNAMGIAYREANMPDAQVAMEINNLTVSGVKGWVVNNADNLSDMKGVLRGWLTFPDMASGEQRTFKEMVSDKDFEAAKKAYQSNLENQLATAAVDSEGLDVRKSLVVDGMYGSNAEVDSANKRVRDKITALKIQREEAYAEERRVGFTNAMTGNDYSSMYARKVYADTATAEEANNLEKANVERWKKERRETGFFNRKRKEQLDDALFNVDKQQGQAELFVITDVWSGLPFDYQKLTSSEGFQKAGGSQKTILEEMKLKAQYDEIKSQMPASIDVEDMIDKAVKSYDTKNLYGYDYLQPDARKELATSLQGISFANKREVQNAVNQAVSKVYNQWALSDEKKKNDVDGIVEIVSSAVADKKPKETQDDVWKKVREELNDKYDSDIVDRMMPYVISRQYVKAIGVANAFKPR